MWRSSLVTHHSSLLLEPFFPATFKDEDVFELRLVTQTARDFATGIAVQSAAINHNLFRRRNRGAPRNFVVKIERLPDSGNKRKRRENERLVDQCRLHRLLMAGAVVTRAVA